MKIRLLLLILVATVLWIPTQSMAQLGSDGVSALGSNLLRVGEGRTGEIPGEQERKRYFEEIANARIFFKNLTLGLRYEMDDPSEVGRSFEGLRRRFISYKKDKLELQAGHVNALFGRGLSVNLFESRPLNYDTWLDGIFGKYEYNFSQEQSEFRPSIMVQGVGGKLDFFDLLATDASLPLKISARAVNGEFGIWGKKLVLGTSFLQAFTSMEEAGRFGPTFTRTEVNQPEVYLSFYTGEFDGFIQFADVRRHMGEYQSEATDVTKRGAALYGSLSYANPDFGLTFEYKNYRYQLGNVDVGSAEDHYRTEFSKLPVSSPPEVYKEFTYTTVTRSTHQVNFDDEIGMQLELTLAAIPEVPITLYGAAASRHRAYIGDSLINSTSTLPVINDLRMAPFWEAFVEAEYEFGELDYIKAMVHRRNDVIVPVTNDALATDRKRTTTVAIKSQYQTTETQSLLGSIEYQWEFDSQEPVDNEQAVNILYTLQYSFNPIITFGGVYDITSRRKPRSVWPQAFISTRIGESHTLMLSYGAERGGLNCTGGICRVVPAFDGLRVTVTSQI